MSGKDIEKVLLLQGGGSLGAFGCGVYKALFEANIEIDIVAGTSIGGINAAIIAGSKDKDHPEKTLEEFWLELAENNQDKNIFPSKGLIKQYTNDHDRIDPYFEEATRSMMTMSSFIQSALYGNRKMFHPRWHPFYAFSDPDYFRPYNWTYLYDHSPLIKTLEKYIDYNKLNPFHSSKPRLLMTAVNVLTAESLIFDSHKQQISSKHILATAGYPMYYLPWVEVEDGDYAWDGSLLSNTPLREVIEVSSIRDKIVYIVENYPKNIDTLPKNILEVRHRARDIMFGDKTQHSMKMSKIITRYLEFIDELYDIIEGNIENIKIEDKNLSKIRKKYTKYKLKHGAEIKKLFYITREEPFPHLFENADFSMEKIKDSIIEGESKTKEVIKKG